MKVTKIDSMSKQYDDTTITGIVLAKAGDQFIAWEYTSFDSKDHLKNCETFDSDAANCYNGHYFNNIADAVTNYNKRTGRL